MKEKSNIDRLFKDALDGYKLEPSGKVWRGIVRKYLSPLSGKRGLFNLQNMLLLILILGAGTIISLTLFTPRVSDNAAETTLQEQHDKTSEEPITVVEHKLTVPAENRNIHKVSSPLKLPQTKPENNDLQNQPDAEISVSNNRDISAMTVIPASSPESDQILLESSESAARNSDVGQKNDDEDLIINAGSKTGNRDESFKTDPFTINAPDKKERLKGSVRYSVYFMSPLLMDELQTKQTYLNFNALIYSSPYQNPPVFQQTDYIRPSRFSLGLYFTPEIINYRDKSKTNKKSLSLDLLASYHFSKAFFRSGLGICYSEDNGDFSIDYNRFDSIGYYYGISSFKIDPGYPDSIIFETYTETVIDTMQLTAGEKTRNMYTYLQVPVMIGYRFYDFKRWSFTLMGGPVFSILIHQNEHQATFSQIHTEVTSIDDNTPGRIKTNWQLMASLGINYKLSSHITLTLEPTYRHYLKSVYEPGNPYFRLPYVWGVRGGLILNF